MKPKAKSKESKFTRTVSLPNEATEEGEVEQKGDPLLLGKYLLLLKDSLSALNLLSTICSHYPSAIMPLMMDMEPTVDIFPEGTAVEKALSVIYMAGVSLAQSRWTIMGQSPVLMILRIREYTDLMEKAVQELKLTRVAADHAK
jgi:hypothetical protein